MTSSEWNVKILPSDWSICTTWSKYSILIGYTLYRQPLLLNCTRNHVVTYTKNVHETFTGFRLAENECICHVTRVQRWNMSANYKQSARCQNLVCLVFERCLFPFILLCNNLISRAISCNGSKLFEFGHSAKSWHIWQWGFTRKNATL